VQIVRQCVETVSSVLPIMPVFDLCGPGVTGNRPDPFPGRMRDAVQGDQSWLTFILRHVIFRFTGESVVVASAG